MKVSFYENCIHTKPDRRVLLKVVRDVKRVTVSEEARYNRSRDDAVLRAEDGSLICVNTEEGLSYVSWETMDGKTDDLFFQNHQMVIEE